MECNQVQVALELSLQGTDHQFVKVKVAQWCLTLCDLMDYTVHGILQARVLEWEASPSPRHLPNLGIELGSPTLQAGSLPIELSEKPDHQFR